METRLMGPPGTGKTTALAARVSAAAAVTDRLLVCSFTRTAAARVAQEDLPLDRERVGTLHSHCYRLLDRPELVERHIDEWNTEQPFYRLTAPRRDLDGGGDAPTGKPTLGDRYRARYDVSRAQFAPVPALVADFARAWEAWKKARGYWDFTDLIARAPSTPPGDAVAVFVDEAQDCTPLELDLLRRWGRNAGELTLAGDADQTLYTWRGADPKAFLNPSVPHVDVPLLQSYRLPRLIHARAQRAIARVWDRFPVDYAPRDADGFDMKTGVRWKRPEDFMARLRDELAAERSVMILASCGYMVAPMCAVLQKRGIAFHNPYRPTASAWNPLASRATTALLAFLRPRADVWGAEARAWTVSDMAKWAALLRPEFLHHPGAVIDLKARRGKDAQATADPEEWLAEGVTARAASCDPGWLREAATYADWKRLAYPVAVAKVPAALRARPQVTIGTVHSVKGAEADTVLLFPDLSPAGNDAWTGRPEARDSVRRMAYVGLTRARERLWRGDAVTSAREAPL